MKTEEIKAMIKDDRRYAFLKTDPHLGGRLMMLCLGGSYSYGTNIETSDVDIRGITANGPEEILGLENFEAYRNSELDVVIYGFRKYVELLMQCNPNIIEMLGVREEDILYLSPLGRTIRDSRDLFLSKRVADSFGGYALSQRRKLENAAARNDIPEALKQEHTLGSMKHSSRHFQDYLRTPGHENDYLKLSLNNNPAIVADVHLTAVPVSDFKMVLQELSEVQKSYAIPLPEKSDSAYAKINKNAMHLVRLYLMATEILEKHEINTYRAKEHDLLMSIRSGEYRAYDGTMLPSYWKLVDDLEQKFKAAKAASTLPDKPNFKRIEQLVMDVSRQSI